MGCDLRGKDWLKQNLQDAAASLRRVRLYERLREITSVSREIETGLQRLKDRQPTLVISVASAWLGAWPKGQLRFQKCAYWSATCRERLCRIPVLSAALLLLGAIEYQNITFYRL